jgi:hypothetical protein
MSEQGDVVLLATAKPAASLVTSSATIIPTLARAADVKGVLVGSEQTSALPPPVCGRAFQRRPCPRDRGHAQLVEVRSRIIFSRMNNPATPSLNSMSPLRMS